MRSEIVNKYKATLSQYIPLEAVDSVFDFLRTYGVHFKITRQRKTKLGDYRWPQLDQHYHQITINGDQNPYAFLIVLIHEFAHLKTYLQHKNKVQPHGLEWQQNYSLLLLSYVEKGVFPRDISQSLRRYCMQLPLKNTREREMMKIVKCYNTDYVEEHSLTLSDLPLNSVFAIADGTVFRSLEKLRTRYKCKRLDNDMLYLVQGHAYVTRIK